MSEWRQFRILVRASLGRLMDAAVAAREADATHFAIWIFALVSTPPLFFAMRMMGKYSFMWRRPDLLERVVLVDRLFFIVYVMLASALLAAMLWDALFPDRQDQEIVGVLPVRPRTLAAARLATALGVAFVFSAGIALPCGFIYMLNVAAGFKSAHVIGWWPAVFVAHVATLTAAGMFTFSALLALRALAVACVGAAAAQRAAAVLQLITVLLLVETLIFLPGVLHGLVNRIDIAGAASMPLPPLWFMGLYAWLAGPPLARVPGLASLALVSTAASLVLAFAGYILFAGWNARRTLEARLKNHTGRSIAFAVRMALPALRDPAARAVFAFTLASLLRSRRHALKIATYIGAAVAVAAVRLMSAGIRDRSIGLDAPADYLLAMPLIVTFLLVAGLQSAFNVPTDIKGNWTFRVAPPKSAASCMHARGLALLLLGVAPVAIAWALFTASMWSAWPAAAAMAMHLASSVALVELTLIGCRSIPFTRAYSPAERTVRGDWVLGLAALWAFGFLLADVQAAAIHSVSGVMLYAGVALAIAAGARIHRSARRPVVPLAFDAPVEGAVETLNLSQAVS